MASAPDFAKFGHNRSVSSTSSFFHDRSDNASMVDFSQNIIQQYLGDNSSQLLPRIKTIELYRKNAKRSNHPERIVPVCTVYVANSPYVRFD